MLIEKIIYIIIDIIYTRNYKLTTYKKSFIKFCVGFQKKCKKQRLGETN